MNQHLQTLLTFIRQTEHLTAEEKVNLTKSVMNADSALTISAFKLERTEKVKRTTAILLEETIEELEQKRKAVEAQNRELETESSLERVRAMAMGMRKPDDLLDICEILYAELHTLGFSELRNAMINIYDDDKSSFLNYDYSANAGKTVTVMPYNFHPLIEKQVSITRNASDAFYEFSFAGKELKDFRELRKNNGEQDDPQLEDTSSLHYYFYSIGTGSVGISTYNAIIDEKKNVLKRFRNVFDFAYRRYMDVAQAEAQAREAKIEAALEKVRSRSLAMHKSEEIEEVIMVVSKQLQQLQFRFHNVSFGFNNDQMGLNFWLASPGQPNPYLMKVPYLDNPAFNNPFEARKNGSDFNVDILTAEENRQFLQHIFDHSVLRNLPEENKKYLLGTPGFARSQSLMKNTILTVANYALVPYTEEQNAVLKRFGNVFEQAYTRFLDLKKAEAQAREAKIEAALERVRSRTLAMQKSDELAETAAVLFKQLILLGIEPNRLYINIIKNETGEAEFWITDEDGSKVSSAFESNMNDNPSFKTMYKGWNEKKKSLMIDMKGKELKEYFQHLGSLHVPFKDGLAQKRRLQYIAYFNKGFIGMASPDEQPEETVFLLERFAAVFNLTFTRFNDLKIVEAHAMQAEEDLIKLQTEKKRAEDAFTELKETQRQLIQSEKMASLGELTAGIAHEIQNPLNFVNNFSEVNKELIAEMKDEMDKGNIEGAKAIASDVAENEQKINHHGKRADAIVKGMLQHSRSSSGVKEPTDINVLADEYLRLAYHGLRAKDKSFNATMKTDYDESIGKINIIPQDIGRVILNLITNAFYAAPLPPEGGFKNPQIKHEPTVWVSTKKAGDKILISVRDNGPGIPQKILDKIFQPFFTTKPTGQGTGLGLSLSYDIVKAHGGEIKVETKDGEGSEFNILLPVV